MANVVQIVITLDNAQANAGLAATTEALNQAGIAGDVSMKKLGGSSDTAASKIRLVVAPVAALNAELRQMGVSSSAAVAGIHQVETATASLEKRAASARGEMQQMMLNIQATQKRDAEATGYRSPVRLGPVSQLGDAFSKIGTAEADAENLGVAFQRMSAAIEPADEGIRRFGGHAASSLDGVRLLSQELGLRLPRALESMLSRIPAVTSAISAMMGVFAGIAIAEVLFRAGEAVYELYEKYISLDAAAEEYSKTVAQQRDADFVNPRTIEDTTDRIHKATQAAKEFAAEGQAIHSSGWLDILGGLATPGSNQSGVGFASFIAADDYAKSGFKSQGQSDALNQKRITDDHQLRSLQIERDHALDGELRGQQKINAEKAKKIALDLEERNYAREQSSALQLRGLRSGGSQVQRLNDQIAEQTAAAETVNLRREVTEKTIAMQNEATNAALRGGALYAAQEREAEATVLRSATATQSQIDAVRLKYHNETMKRIQDETDAIAKREQEERAAGVTGLARIQATGQGRISDINQREQRGEYADETGPGQTSKLAARDRANADEQMLREMADSEKAYQKQVQTESDRTNSYMLTGFAKVDAEQEQSTQRRVDTFTEMYDDMDHAGATYLAAQQRLESDVAAIHANGVRERQQLTQQINDQTLQMDREAAQAERRVRADGLAGWVQGYRDSLAEIQAAQLASRTKIDSDQQKNGGDPTQYERRKVDADRIANAQIMQANQQMRQQVASTLQGAFDDPIHYIQNRMKQMFFQILADWVMQSTTFKSLFSHTMGGLQIGGTAKPSVLQQTAVSSPDAMQAAGISPAGVQAVMGGTIDQALVKPGVSGTNPPSGVPGASSSSTADQGYSIPQIEEGGGGMVGTSMLSASTGIVGIGLNAARALMGHKNPASTATSFGNADNGEDGGFAGYMTGDADAGTNGIATSQAQLAGTDDVGSAASRQVQTANQNLAADAQSSGVSQALGVVGAGVGAYTGAQGVVSAFESGHASGILSGAVSGATAGGAIGMLAGPLGGAIGAGIGAAVGATAGLVGWASGEGGRLGAGKYFKDTIRPQMEEEQANYLRGGGGTAVSAISQVNSTAMQGYMYMANKFGADAAMWAKDAYLDKEREKVTDDINRLASAGRDYGARSAVQFHTGGRISGFGDLATSGTEGFIHALMGETVINPVGSSAHGPYLSAVNAGATPADVAAMYLKSSNASSSGSGSSGDTQHHHYNINAIDAKSFRSFLRNGGGMDAIAAESTKRDTRYAGDAA